MGSWSKWLTPKISLLFVGPRLDGGGNVVVVNYLAEIDVKKAAPKSGFQEHRFYVCQYKTGEKLERV